ncbi:signal peptidase I [Pelagibius marinus]|uniref:signal peptidase I n=1 Tax=Pelagibius marinus TaxID=2762760 RepID=UPI00187247EB|nr:signal peptidase I [Pelagibius marinus]
MLYLGRWLWALVYALAAAWVIVLPLLSAHFGFLPTPVGVTMGGLAAVYCLVGALHCCREAGEGGSKTSEDRLLAMFLLLGGPLLLALMPKVLWEPYSVPAGSMEPSLQVGDYLFVSKFIYQFVEPQRGDVAVFLLPSDDATTYIKRLVGLPGDRVQMKAGSLNINGERVPQEEVEQPAGEQGELYRETLSNGRSYMIRELGEHMPLDDTGVFEVPAGHYFFLGDNRDNSVDSRVGGMMGYVPRENLRGRLAVVVWNSEAQRLRLFDED